MLLRTLVLALLFPASALADAGEGEPDCQLEEPLSTAAAELLLEPRKPTAAELTRAVRAAGSDVVGVRALLVRNAEAGRMRAWLDDFKREADAQTVCGFASGAEARLLIVAARAGSLGPLDAQSSRIRGRLQAGWSRPELVVADGYGEFIRLPLDAAALARGVPIDEQLARPARVQLLARGPHGPRPVAERLLPAFDEVLPEARADEAGADEREIDPSSALHDLRRRHGTMEMRDNRLLARVASAHASEVCNTGLIAHELVAGEDPERRLLRAGVRARRVGETVARAGSLSAAFAAFERSPSHLMTLVERGFTDFGIGSATDEEEHTCLVILLASWPRYVGR